jgi:hypothetical protein
MSRSYKKKPFTTFVNSKSVKGWEHSYHRANRSKVKQKLHQFYDDDDLYLEGRKIEMSDTWSGPRDGKQYYFGYAKSCKQYDGPYYKKGPKYIIEDREDVVKSNNDYYNKHIRK